MWLTNAVNQTYPKKQTLAGTGDILPHLVTLITNRLSASGNMKISMEKNVLTFP